MNENQISTNYVLSTNIEIITEFGIQIAGLSNINQELSCHYLIYRIENQINGRYYIGQHQTENPLDKYMGSGKILNQAFNKYGLSSFVKTILFDFDNFEDMNNKEIELVQLSNCYPYDQMSYNLKPGGNNSPLTDEIIQRILATRNSHYDEWHNAILQAKRNEWENKIDEERAQHIERMRKQGLLDMKGEKNPMYGKQISSYMEPEAYQKWIDNVTQKNRERAKDPIWLAKMSEVNSGENNPMYGHSCTEYMTDEEIAKWKTNISKATSGENNPMYGKSSWEKCTPEQRANRAKRFSQSMKGKNKGRKMMQLPGTNELKFVHPNDIQSYLDQGYVFSNRHKRQIIYKMPPLC